MVSLVLQALKQHGEDIGIAFSGAEDVALVEYAHLTGRPYRVFRYFNAKLECMGAPVHGCTCVVDTTHCFCKQQCGHLHLS